MSMERAQANAVLMDRISLPVFFTKLANDYGIQPADKEEAGMLIKMAGQLYDGWAAENVKEAQARKRGLAVASSHLDQVLGINGSGDQEVKAAAANAVQDPAVRAALAAIMSPQKAGE